MREATATIAPVATERPRRVKRWFYISMATLMIVLHIVAFGPAIIDQSARNVPLPLTPLVLAHTIVSAGWLLFLAQATLVAAGRVAVHRRVGLFGALLTVLFIAVGYLALLEEARRGFDLSGDLAPSAFGRRGARSGLDGLLWNFLTFGVLAGAGLLYRNRPVVHKHFMLLALLGGLTNTPIAHLVWPALQPWAGIIFLVSNLCLRRRARSTTNSLGVESNPCRYGAPLWCSCREEYSSP